MPSSAAPSIEAISAVNVRGSVGCEMRASARLPPSALKCTPVACPILTSPSTTLIVVSSAPVRAGVTTSTISLASSNVIVPVTRPKRSVTVTVPETDLRPLVSVMPEVGDRRPVERGGADGGVVVDVDAGDGDRAEDVDVGGEPGGLDRAPAAGVGGARRGQQRQRQRAVGDLHDRAHVQEPRRPVERDRDRHQRRADEAQRRDVDRARLEADGDAAGEDPEQVEVRDLGRHGDDRAGQAQAGLGDGRPVQRGRARGRVHAHAAVDDRARDAGQRGGDRQAAGLDAGEALGAVGQQRDPDRVARDLDADLGRADAQLEVLERADQQLALGDDGAGEFDLRRAREHVRDVQARDVGQDREAVAGEREDRRRREGAGRVAVDGGGPVQLGGGDGACRRAA